MSWRKDSAETSSTDLQRSDVETRASRTRSSSVGVAPQVWGPSCKWIKVHIYKMSAGAKLLLIACGNQNYAGDGWLLDDITLEKKRIVVVS